MALASVVSIQSARADAVTEWNEHWEEMVFATGQAIPAHARFAAILHVAVFDAVNGIARKYTPYHVTDPAPPGAREEAAAIEAAYTVLRTLYPSQAAALDAHRKTALAKLPGASGSSQSIKRGLAWGEFVANRILSLRQSDGWAPPPPPYFGSFEIGRWRSIPFDNNSDGTVPAVAAQLAVLIPFAMTSPSQFRPGPPYGLPLEEALASPQYAADLNEVKTIGRWNSPFRTADETRLALLWQAMGPVDENRAARSVVPAHHKLVENARLFALLNMVACDALIASMESKFTYGLWRPHHAIRFADLDNNPETHADSEWAGLVLAPRFPEYVANHACLTGGFMHALARMLGDEHTFEISSPNYPGFTWSFERFSDAALQAGEARIWGGIHYRNSCDVGRAVGEAVADHVLDNFLLPLH